MATKPMADWFNSSINHTTATFGPGLGDTHRRIFDSFREMAASMKYKRSTKDSANTWIVDHQGNKFLFNFKVNRNGSQLHSDYKEIGALQTVRLLKSLANQRVQVIQIMTKQLWMEIIFCRAGVKYLAEISLQQN